MKNTWRISPKPVSREGEFFGGCMQIFHLIFKWCDRMLQTCDRIFIVMKQQTCCHATTNLQSHINKVDVAQQQTCCRASTTLLTHVNKDAMQIFHHASISSALCSHVNKLSMSRINKLYIIRLLPPNSCRALINSPCRTSTNSPYHASTKSPCHMSTNSPCHASTASALLLCVYSN